MSINDLFLFPVKIALAIFAFIAAVLFVVLRFGKDLGAGLAKLGLTSAANAVDDADNILSTLYNDVEKAVTDLKAKE